MTDARVPKRLGCLRALGIFLLAAALLILLLYLEEDWRGANELTAAKKRWHDAGISLNPSDYEPPPIPDSQNLAALPEFQLEPDPAKPTRMLAVKLLEATNEEMHGGLLDNYSAKNALPASVAAAYAKMFPGATAPPSSLAQLETLYPILGHLRAAAPTRPDFRLNLDKASPMWERPLGLMVYQDRVAELLADHAQLALRENQPQVALEDIRIGSRIASGLSAEPSPVAGLVAIAVVSVTRRNIDEEIHQHAWTDAQLAVIQDEIQQTNCLAMFQLDMRGQAATFTLPFYAGLKSDPSVVALVFPVIGLIRGMDQYEDDDYQGDNHAAALIFWCLFARGWWDMNEARMLDFELREAATVDPKARRVDVKASTEIEADVLAHRWPPVPWKMMYGVGASSMTSLLKKFAEGQVELDEDRIACALERYRLAHGAYPADLASLTPASIDELPHDILNGAPYHYRLNPDGTFLLYSVGWNQIDDGGKVALLSGSNPPRIDFDNGDWVWPMVKR
jgi:hypothetical protein